MDAENPAIYDSRQDEKIEDLATRLPDRRISVLLLTLLVKTVHLGDLAAFMVASNEGDPVGKPENVRT